MFVVAAERADEAVARFRSQGVGAAVVGRVTDSGRLRVELGGETVVDLPAGLVAGGTPSVHWEQAESLPPAEPYPEFDPPSDLGRVLLDLLGEPGIRDVSSIYERYDQTVGNRTVRGPGSGEAAVLRLPGSSRAFALSLVGDGAGCAVDPYHGVQALLGEAVRNLACVGAEALAVTDGINVGSPTDPVEFLRLTELIRGLGDGLRLLGVPVTGGNCSLYNESPSGAIPPTPVIGALGSIEDRSRVPRPGPVQGEEVLLLGDPAAGPTFSVYGRLRTGWVLGPAPAADLEADRRLAAFLVEQCRRGRVGAAKDAAAGGPASALVKLCLRGGVGARIVWHPGRRPDWALFGELPGVAWVSAAPDLAAQIEEAARRVGLACRRTGTMGGDRFVVEGLIDLSLDELRAAYFGAREMTDVR